MPLLCIEYLFNIQVIALLEQAIPIADLARSIARPMSNHSSNDRIATYDLLLS